MKNRDLLSGVAIAVSLLAAGSSLAVGMMNRGMARHHQGMMGGIPEPYTGMQNPLPVSKEVIGEGKKCIRPTVQPVTESGDMVMVRQAYSYHHGRPI